MRYGRSNRLLGLDLGSLAFALPLPLSCAADDDDAGTSGTSAGSASTPSLTWTGASSPPSSSATGASSLRSHRTGQNLIPMLVVL